MRITTAFFDYGGTLAQPTQPRSTSGSSWPRGWARSRHLPSRDAAGGMAPREAVHVGDTYEDDVMGARSAGLRPILVDREDRHPEADCLRVRNLREVEALVASAK